MHWRDEYARREPDAPLFDAEGIERAAAELKQRVLELVRGWDAQRAAPSVVSLLPRLALQRDGRGRRLATAHYSAVHRALELLAADGLIAPEMGGWRATADGRQAACPTGQREVAA